MHGLTMYTIGDKELAYIAGFFDGEGCIRGTKQGTLSIGAVNTDVAPLKFIEGIFGGSIYEQPADTVRKSVFHWRIGGMKAAVILKFLLPYFIVKKEQAILGIELASTSDKWRKVRIVAKLGALKRD